VYVLAAVFGNRILLFWVCLTLFFGLENCNNGYHHNVFDLAVVLFLHKHRLDYLLYGSLICFKTSKPKCLNATVNPLEMLEFEFSTAKILHSAATKNKQKF
jgi:hypothetical protein